ncbi:YhcH/YjgK/YiaL family protein [Sulfurovum sp. TSL1]|uniref:YhcH/YjgK/YiaL family protein n=1 Tax=Sulfurovum sp. TSL1 TaxID=2826994 RepID=UPI001CC6512B|nr:YhcH/YjgK/YiaL family protein [Sulfurovum sp. TSL1]GIT97981.1 beta-D-galactosidase [Sulfurovum sp. TSL1]
MIIDRLENWEHYRFGPAWTKAFEFLLTLSPNAEEKKYTIDGDDIFAIVMRYDTCSPETSLFESHRKYVDIQTTLIGTERFECSFTDTLSVQTPYDDATDVQWYKRMVPGQTRVDVSPDTFVMLYPHDAHMAALMTGERSEHVKKVVVKIKAELLLDI